MKKITSILLILALALSLALPAFAEERQVDLTYTLVPPTPSYTVSIPADMDLAFGSNLLTLTVESAANLGGQQIVFSFAGTQIFMSGRYTTLLQKAGASPIQGGIYYSLYDLDNAVLTAPTTPQYAGIVLARFNGEGEQDILIDVPEDLLDKMFGINAINAEAEKDVPYTGTITFGVALV